jgi:hypothetical protein
MVSSCLDSLDVFRDLLEGIPHQRNRVVRDVCKNLELRNYRSGEIVYNVGDKVDELYFCIAGLISICIIEEVPRDPVSSPIQTISRTKTEPPSGESKELSLHTSPSLNSHISNSNSFSEPLIF